MFRKTISLLLSLSLIAQGALYAAPQPAAGLNLPPANQFIPLSQEYSFPLLKGLKFDPHNPLNLEFIVDTADKDKVSKQEASMLIRYFLAGLTIPEQDIWVNLNPREPERIITEELSRTDLGKDLLSQDYILKQLTASLTYPENTIGQDYWEKAYAELSRLSGNKPIPASTLNRVWITPDKAEVYENKTIALISEASLKAVMEEEYTNIKNQISNIKNTNQDSKIKEQTSRAASHDYVFKAIERAGYTSGKDIKLALDMAAGSFYSEEKGVYEFQGGDRDSEYMINYYIDLAKRYKDKIISIEDGLYENDWGGWQRLTAAMRAHGIRTIGDDLLVTQMPRLNRAIKDQAATDILIKVNQNGTMRGTLEVIKNAKKAHMNCVVSHRSGETVDYSIADLAYAINALGLKTGDPQPGYDFGKGRQYERRELVRRVKYERMVEIEARKKERAAWKSYEAEFGKGLKNGDRKVANEIGHFYNNLSSEQQEMFYEWLQRHQSSQSAEAISVIGFSWSWAVKKLRDIAFISPDGNLHGNPRSAARQLEELAEEGTLGNIRPPEEIAPSLQREAREALADHPELRELIEFQDVPAFPRVEEGEKPGYLVLMRHGQTNWNEGDGLFNKWAGWLQSLITEKGRKDAREIGRKLRGLDFDIAFSSDLTRARETLEEFLEGIGQKDISRKIGSALREKNYGFLAGWRRETVKSKVGEELFSSWRRALNGRAPGGESLADVKERLIPYLVKEILPRIAEGKNVVISAHGNSLRALLILLREHTRGHHLGDKEIENLEVPLSTPIGIRFDADLKIKDKELWLNRDQVPAQEFVNELSAFSAQASSALAAKSASSTVAYDDTRQYYGIVDWVDKKINGRDAAVPPVLIDAGERSREYVPAGNWKMAPQTIKEAVLLIRKEARRIQAEIKELGLSAGDIDVIIPLAVPFTQIPAVGRELKRLEKLNEKDNNKGIAPGIIALAAQDVSQFGPEKDGLAHTGDSNAGMLKDAGVKYIIVGHSERRALGETNRVVNRKAKQAIKAGLIPIICVGETEAQREAGETFKVIAQQVEHSTFNLITEKFVIAYEPVWAIGTGKTAAPEQAQEVHQFIRAVFLKQYALEHYYHNKSLSSQYHAIGEEDFDKAAALQILYGGSVKPDNIENIIAQQDVDGVLVGGASLDAGQFGRIVQATITHKADQKKQDQSASSAITTETSDTYGGIALKDMGIKSAPGSSPVRFNPLNQLNKLNNSTNSIEGATFNIVSITEIDEQDLPHLFSAAPLEGEALPAARKEDEQQLSFAR